MRQAAKLRDTSADGILFELVPMNHICFLAGRMLIDIAFRRESCTPGIDGVCSVGGRCKEKEPETGAVASAVFRVRLAASMGF